MTTTETILNILDALFSLWILVSLLLPGRNPIKDIAILMDVAIPILVIIIIIQMVAEYPETRDSIINIVGWIFGSDLPSK